MQIIKVLIKYGFVVFALPTLISSCKKETISNTDKISGLWIMEANFWDKDSNGLDSGDHVSYVSIPDTILWNFLPNGEVEYYVNSKRSHTGNWAVSIESDKSNNQFLLLEYDINYSRYLYRVDHLDNESCVIYTKKQLIQFSTPYIKWEGYMLKKISPK